MLSRNAHHYQDQTTQCLISCHCEECSKANHCAGIQVLLTPGREEEWLLVCIFGAQ
jgi:hypothetical protein